MDKNAIKAYAVEARRNLMEAVHQKAYSLYIYEDGALPQGEALNRLRADGIFLSTEHSNARLWFCNELTALGQKLNNKAAYRHMIEEVAYTWFNRLIALRFMEINEYLPSGIRILSSREPGRIEPDAVRGVERLNYVNQSKIAEMRADTSFNAAEKLYKYILVSQCNALSDILPGMFQKANDYTELLLPDALLAKGGIVYSLVNKIEEKNFKIRTSQDEAAIMNGTLKEEDAPAGQIEIIGWLYQYYIAEKKDEVFANLKKNIKINSDTIPAATQLFTPEWIVKYMVENSLGRLWLDRPAAEGNSASGAALRSKWKYYVDEAKQEPAVAEQLRVLRAQSPVKRPEDIKIIDPCMGSGHILVYAFDLLFQIYQSEGYFERDIPNLILQNNLYGLDIDDRAGQLSYFALMMKARNYNRRFFRQDSVPQPMVYTAKNDHELAEYGSLVKADGLGEKPVLSGQISLDDIDYKAKLNAWNFRSILAQKYDVVVTNPPYMAPAPSQADWVKKNYPDSKSDLCVVFIERNFDLLKPNGYLSMITMHSWMFLSSYERFREKLIASRDIVNMAHLGARAFEEIGGEVVQTTALVARSPNIPGYLATYARLVGYVGQQAKEEAFLGESDKYNASADSFAKIPGSPVAYWVSRKALKAFDNPTMNDLAEPRHGLATSNNALFLKLWFEVDVNKSSIFDLFHPEKYKWIPMNKGGSFRKWFGNNEWVINYENDGSEIKKFAAGIYVSASRTIQNTKYYFQKSLTWNALSSGDFSVRSSDAGYIFGSGGYCAFVDVAKEKYILALLNNVVTFCFVSAVSPTMNYEVGHIKTIPVIIVDEIKESVDSIVTNNITLSRTDWDSFETSWDFKTHPLIAFRCKQEEAQPLIVEDGSVEGMIVTEWSKTSSPISQAFDAWERHCDRQFGTLKRNEEELNRIFIEIYGLQDELTPEVEDKDITVRKAGLGRDIRSFVSYAVGCMFGRYSLDEPGLAFAGGKFDISKYNTFMPEDDNIIPIGSADYFEDDIVVRFTEFVRAVYGDNTLGENLSFIADALYPNGNGSAQDRIRRYFLTGFYKDHVKVYQKRPIYWLMDSGKKDGFKALFYLHRYDKYTVARARTDYLHPLQRKYDAEVKRLEMLSAQTDNAREKAAYRKEIDIILAKMDECRVYDQIVSHIAHQQIELELDCGVKVNYKRFQDVDVLKDNGKTETMDLLGRI